MTALDRARAEHVEQQNAEWHENACPDCTHLLASHDDKGCTARTVGSYRCDCRQPQITYPASAQEG